MADNESLDSSIQKSMVERKEIADVIVVYNCENLNMRRIPLFYANQDQVSEGSGSPIGHYEIRSDGTPIKLVFYEENNPGNEAFRQFRGNVPVEYGYAGMV